jgi:iron complex transport system substrate-binding protein
VAAVADVDGAPAVSPRVVSLVPAATEMLYALDSGDLVVGVSSYDRWPPEVAALPKVGALIDPDVERVLALRPDLVVVDPAQRGLIAQLAAAGIDAYPYATGSLQDVIEHASALGVAIGRPERGRRLAGALRARLDAVAAAVAGHPRPSVLLVFGRRPGAFSELWVNGGDGFLADLLRLSGGQGLFEHLDRPSFRASLEALLANPPAVVIEADDAPREALESQWRALPGFAAVRVVRLDPSVALVPGPRVVETAELLARALHPER